eukprot:8979661-Pyramimonas_sp.AAC.1
MQSSLEIHRKRSKLSEILVFGRPTNSISFHSCTSSGVLLDSLQENNSQIWTATVNGKSRYTSGGQPSAPAADPLLIFERPCNTSNKERVGVSQPSAAAESIK